MKPVLFGCAGLALSEAESSFFAAADPFGFILFKRNCETREQVRALVASLRDAVGRDAPVFVDQEGGRVARLGPPAWEALPAAGVLGDLYLKDAALGREAAMAHATVTAWMLTDVGINGNCAPVLDLRLPETSAVIGNRSFGADPQVVAELGGLVVDTFLACGVLPVIKHLPGHGRVKVDPHFDLPFVDDTRDVLENADFLPFKALAHAPIGMNCHVVFRALDPETPVSLSAKVHQEILRDTIGFTGLIFTDDLAMKALRGAADELALDALKAGADVVLYCPGTMPEMVAIADALPEMGTPALHRYDIARARLGPPCTNEACVHALERLRTLTMTK